MAFLSAARTVVIPAVAGETVENAPTVVKPAKTF